MRIAALLSLALSATLLAPPAALACVQPRCWTTGVVQYDGAGNIRAMGADRYTYDRV